MSAYSKLAHKIASKPASRALGVPRLGLPQRKPDVLQYMHGPLLKRK